MSWGNSKLQVQILMFYTCVSFWDILNPNIARAANEVPCHQECKGPSSGSRFLGRDFVFHALWVLKHCDSHR